MPDAPFWIEGYIAEWLRDGPQHVYLIERVETRHKSTPLIHFRMLSTWQLHPVAFDIHGLPRVVVRPATDEECTLIVMKRLMQ